MREGYSLNERYLRDQLPIGLGNLASNWTRIKSPSQNAANGQLIENLLQESNLFIEGTAQDPEIEIAAELVELQTQLACWQYSWARIWEDATPQMRVRGQARIWSVKVLNMSGLLAVNQRRAIALFLLGRFPQGQLRFTPCVQASHFKIVEMDKIVSGKRSWVTPGLIEYAWWGDRPSEPAIGSSIHKAVNLYNRVIRMIMRD